MDDDIYAGAFLLDLSNLCVVLPRYRPIALFIVSNVVRSYAVGDEIKPALMPNALPAVE